MDYEPSNAETNEEPDAAVGLDIIEESDDSIQDAETTTDSLKELEQLEKGGKTKARQASRHSLEVRRAIEDHIEQKRLRKDLDYLYDEHFSDNK